MTMKYIVIFILILFSNIQCKKSQTGNISSMDPEELRNILQEGKVVQIVDVRTNPEFLQGSIPNSINLPLSDLESGKFPDKLDKTKTIIVVCSAGGQRSQIGQKILFKKGYTNSRFLLGGYLGYTKK